MTTEILYVFGVLIAIWLQVLVCRTFYTCGFAAGFVHCKLLHLKTTGSDGKHRLTLEELE